MWWSVFFKAFPQCCCSVDLGLNRVSGSDWALFVEQCVPLTPSVLRSHPPGSLLPADRLAGPLVFTVWFLWPSQTWKDRQKSFGLGKRIIRQLEETGKIPLGSVYLAQTHWMIDLRQLTLILQLFRFSYNGLINFFLLFIISIYLIMRVGYISDQNSRPDQNPDSPEQILITSVAASLCISLASLFIVSIAS